MKSTPSPRIIIDTREQTPLSFANLEAVSGALYSGDYSIEGIEESFSIERKSIADLVGSLTSGRDRFMNELHRLRGFRFRRLLVVGSRSEIENGEYRSKARPRSILASLAAVEVRFDIPIIFEATPEQAALRIEKWAWWMWRESLKPVEAKLKTPEWAI